MSEEEVNYRKEVLRLVTEGKISDETLREIYTKQLLDETNERIADTLKKEFSELMTFLKLVDHGESMKKDLENNELFKRDVKYILCYITSWLILLI